MERSPFSASEALLVCCTSISDGLGAWVKLIQEMIMGGVLQKCVRVPSQSSAVIREMPSGGG